MRLLLLTDITYPCNTLPFPAAVFNQRLTELGHEPVWIMRSTEEQDTVQKTEWNKNPVYTLPSHDYDPKRIFVRYTTERLASHPAYEIVRSAGPFDGLYVRNDLAMGMVASSISSSHSIPYFHRISHLKAETTKYRARSGQEEAYISGYLKGTFGQILRKHICNQADYVLPISDAIDEYLEEDGYRTPRKVIPTGVDCRRERPESPTQFRSEFGIQTDRKLLIYIGALSPERRPHFLIDTLTRVNDEHDAALAILGGRKEERIKLLQEYAQKRGVANRTIFTGWIDDKKTIESGIATADVALSPLPPDVPSLFLSSPVKVNEYLRQETPVVGSNIPEHHQVIEGSDGGYCVNYDSSCFASAIDELLANPVLRERMGRKGREFVESTRCYDLLSDKMLEAFEETIRVPLELR